MSESVQSLQETLLKMESPGEIVVSREFRRLLRASDEFHRYGEATPGQERFCGVPLKVGPRTEGVSFQVVSQEDLQLAERMRADAERLALCVGCHNNFYNGNNPYGIKRCWMLDSAKPVKAKFVGIDDRPPWDTQPIEDTLNCHRRRRHVKVCPEVMS